MEERKGREGGRKETEEKKDTEIMKGESRSARGTGERAHDSKGRDRGGEPAETLYRK